MSMYVSLDLMKTHLRIETEDEEQLVETLINEVSAAASDYCYTDFSDSVPGPVSLAVRLKVSFFFENRDIPDRQAYLATDEAFHALLYPYRDPEKMF